MQGAYFRNQHCSADPEYIALSMRLPLGSFRCRAAVLQYGRIRSQGLIKPMNQKELNELRRCWKQDKNTISRVYGCFVNGNKEIITDLDESLGMMTQEEAEKYLSLLKKALSGALGKNLIYCVFHPAGHDGRRTQNVDGAARIRCEGCADAAGILSESH